MLAVAFITAPLPWPLGSMNAWLLLPWLALPLAVAVARVVRTRVDGPSLNGALARTGALQLVFCLLYAAGILASRRHRPVKLGIRRETLKLRTPLRTSYGELAERELAIVALSDDDGVVGYGEAAPLPAYGGPDWTACGARWRATRGCWQRRGELARRRAARSVPAGRRPARRRSPRWTWRCGTARDSEPGGRWRRCSATTPRRAWRSTQRSPRSTGPARPTRPRGRRARASGA